MKKLLLIAALCVTGAALFAQNVSDFEIQGNDDNTMTILNYKGLAKDIVIPETIFNMPVTRLREGAFREKGLTSVVIPSGITFIGDNTFRGNQLTSVTMPDSVEYLGNYAFAENRLTAVTIPEKVTTIGDCAFASNQLTSITIPDSVVYIGASAFDGNRLSTVVIGNGTVYIGPSAFTCYGRYSNDNQISSVTLGNSVKYIGASAFYYHRITTLEIPEGVVYIGGRAFEPGTSNALTSITLGKYVMFGTDSGYGAFHDNVNFDTIYQNTDKRAGTYTLANNNWSFTPAP